MNGSIPEDLYRDVPREQVERLRRFRTSHPHRRLAVDDVKWSVIDTGEGREAILLLPGGIRVAESWFKAIEALRDEYRILCPTYPALTTMADYVEGVRVLVDNVGMAGVHMVGNSFGGWLAQCFVRTHPLRVKSLILSSTSGPEGFPLWQARLAGLVARIYPLTLLRLALKRQYLNLLDPPEEESAFWKAFVDELAQNTTRQDVLAQYEMTSDYVRRYRFTAEDLQAWRGRILIVEPEQDPAFRAKAKAALRALYPQAEVHRLPGAGHTEAYTEPRAYLQILRTFLAAG